MLNDDANELSNAPRLIGVAGLLLGMLVTMLVIVSGGASAAPGDADLSITKTDSPDPVVAGSNLTYTIKVENPGISTGPATNVVVTDTRPSGVDHVSATGGSCQKSGSTVTCDLGQVNAGSTATVTIVVKTKKPGTLSNTASVSSPEDVVLTNNSATATTTVSSKPAKPKKKKGKASCAAPTIAGTAGNDVINGTSGADVIVTYAGNDQVSAGD